MYALLTFVRFCHLADLFPHKYREFSRPEVSFAARIDGLHKENTRLDREVSEWKDQAARESESR